MHSQSNNAQHVHVDYNLLKGMLVLISSLKLSIGPYVAGPERRGHARTAFVNISMSSWLPRFIVRWILNFMEKPTYENHENWYPTNKSDFTVAEFTTIYAITTKLVRSNHIHSEIYSMQHYVIKFVSDLRQVGAFHRVIRLPPSIKLITSI
jgi:hypothetical protein